MRQVWYLVTISLLLVGTIGNDNDRDRDTKVCLACNKIADSFAKAVATYKWSGGAIKTTKKAALSHKFEVEMLTEDLRTLSCKESQVLAGVDLGSTLVTNCERILEQYEETFADIVAEMVGDRSISTALKEEIVAMGYPQPVNVLGKVVTPPVKDFSKSTWRPAQRIMNEICTIVCPYKAQAQIRTDDPTREDSQSSESEGFIAEGPTDPSQRRGAKRHRSKSRQVHPRHETEL